MKKIDLMMYDFDGTICNTLPDIVNSMNAVLVNNGYPAIAMEKVRSFIGSGISKLVERSIICALSGDNNDRVPAEVVARVTSEMSEHYSRHLMDSSFLYEDAITVLEHFSGVSQIIVSNKPQKMIEAMLDHYNVSQYFDLVVGGDTLDVCKPDPKVWTYIQKEMALKKPVNCVMVGDSIPDLLFGKVSDATTVAVTYGYNDLPALKKEGADYFIDRLTELITVL